MTIRFLPSRRHAAGTTKTHTWKRLLLVTFLLALASMGIFGIARKVQASSSYQPIALGYGDPHDCTSLGAHDGVSTSFDSPDSDTFSYAGFSPLGTFTWTGSSAHGASTVVACDDTPTPSVSWDGYGDPFQCEELAQRYAYVRWDDDPRPGWAGGSWGGDAQAAWGTHPSHFQQVSNTGSANPPTAGDLLVWGPAPDGSNPAGHIAIITSVDLAHHTLTTLEQNFHASSGALIGSDTMTFSSNNVIQNDRGVLPLDGWLHDSTPAFTPNQRIGALDTGGNVVVKDGSLGAGWVGEIAGATATAISGTRIGFLDNSGTLLVKEGALNAQWATEFSGATAFALTNVDSAHQRIGVLDTNGNVLVKEGALNAQWATEFSGATALALSGSRIGVLDTNGTFWVKDGSLGAGWTQQMTGVRAIGLSGTRIGALDTNGNLWVKDGALNAQWSLEFGGATAFALTDVDPAHQRIGVMDTGGNVLVKEGALNATWATEFRGATALALYDTRIGVLDTSGTFWAKDGTLGAQWSALLANTQQIALPDASAGV